MATMVASRAVSSTMAAIQEKVSRNKRKFHADPPIAKINSAASPALQNELSEYDVFNAEKSAELCGVENHGGGGCSMCKAGNISPNLSAEESQDADWSDFTEAQLEEMLLSNLDVAFKSAIKKITTFGYCEKVATNAVLSSGNCYGSKDTLSNIVENTLASLKNAKKLDCSPRENVAEDLKKMEKRVLADMISVLRDVRPFFNTGEAMWWLLMADANVSHACVMDRNALSNVDNEERTCSLNAGSNSNAAVSQEIPDLNVPLSEKLSSELSYPQNVTELEMPKVSGVQNFPHGKPLPGNYSSLTSKPKPAKENLMSSSNKIEESSFPTVSSRKLHLGTSKRDTILRQKTIHFEKSYRALGSRAVMRACKQNGLGSLMLDRRCKATIECTTTRSSVKIEKSVDLNKPLADANLSLSFSSGPISNTSSSGKKVNSKSPVPLANTELSLSLPSTGTAGTSPIQESDTGVPNCSNNYAGTSFDKISQDWIPMDEKDEMLLLLVPLMREFQSQVQDWTDWAQQRVMQATHRLTKDKGELQILRQEKEEINRLQKERHSLEDNTKKKLAEMKSAIAKASSQVEKANTTARKLDLENAQLRMGMEAARLQASESATKCSEVSRRELNTLKLFQAWDRQKELLQEELAAEKLHLRQLQQQLDQLEENLYQSEAKWRQEENLKNEALAKASSERKEREKNETSARYQENALKLKADTDLQRSKNDIRRLEQQIAQLKLLAESPGNITVPRWSSDKTYASFLSDGKKNNNPRTLSKIISSHELGLEDVQRERECVMCLCEEMSVVFLPCAHQVVCTKCNDLHEKQGMKDCPSCRAPIQRRICVRSGF